MHVKLLNSLNVGNTINPHQCQVIVKESHVQVLT